MSHIKKEYKCTVTATACTAATGITRSGAGCLAAACLADWEAAGATLTRMTKQLKDRQDGRRNPAKRGRDCVSFFYY